MISHCDLRAACDGRALAENMDDAAQQTTLAASSLAPQPPQALLSVLFYDDRYNETRDRPRLPIYRSLDRSGIPFLVGPPVDAFATGAVQASDGRPGDGPALHGKLRYRPGAKVDWIMKTLPTLSSDFVFLLDTDTIWLCSANEVIRKRAALLRELSARDDSVVVFGERGMWPPSQEFRGTHLRLNKTAGYPPAEPGQPFRYINAGAALGRPRDLLALHACMRERYRGFPNACPAGHGPNGELRYYAAEDSWQPPPMSHPRVFKYHNVPLKGTNWGWEQGCFHNYYLEQRNGELPERCPRIVLDRAGHTMVHLAGNNQHFFKWTADTSSGAPQPHVVFKESHEKVCALHANGPAKKALRPIWRWWGENATGRPPAWA